MNEIKLISAKYVNKQLRFEFSNGYTVFSDVNSPGSTLCVGAALQEASRHIMWNHGLVNEKNNE